MMKTALCASIAAMSFAAGSAVADTQIATNGQGDLNFVPLAVADGGWRTEIDLINSSRYRSTVTKINIREQQNSNECLDFFVYLSPGDRFVGKFMAAADLPQGTAIPKMQNGEDARLVFFSTDDSVRSLTTQSPASESDPAVYPIQENIADLQPLSCQIAYIEGIQSASFDLGPALVSKQDIIDIHDGRKVAAVNDKNASNVQLADTDFPVNTTSGNYTYINPLNGVKMSNAMEAYQDYDNNRYLSVGAPTIIGQNTGYSVLPAQIETGAELVEPGMVFLDRAMAKQNIIFPFEHNTTTPTTQLGAFGVISFPTRQGFINSQSSSYDPFYNPGAVVPIRTHIRDMKEVILSCDTPPNPDVIISPPPPTVGCEKAAESLTQEVNLIDIRAKIEAIVAVNAGLANGGTAGLDANFQKGWMNINILTDSEEDYVGAPAVASVIQFMLSPTGTIQGTVKSAAYTKGVEEPGANGCDPYPTTSSPLDLKNGFGDPEDNNPPGSLPDSDTCAGSASLQN